MVVTVLLLDLLNVILKEIFRENNFIFFIINKPMLTVVFGSTSICERVKLLSRT
jgi:hypothetical protein